MRAALFLALALFAAPAAAQDTARAAEAAADRLAAASEQLAEAQASRDRVAALTETVRAYEAGLASLRDGLRRAAIRERSIAVELEARRDRIAALLAALQSISQTPAPVLMLHPGGALGTARAGLIASEVRLLERTRWHHSLAHWHQLSLQSLRFTARNDGKR